MELRTTEEKINDLLAVYKGIRRSSLLRPEQQALLPPTPNELEATTTTATTLSVNKDANDEDRFVRSLRTTEQALAELQPRAEKFRKRLFEIDPVTEKPRYGPKSQARVRLLVTKHEFLCCQFSSSFPEEQEQRFLRSKKYQRQQLDLQDQRQEERRQEHSKQQELLQQQKEQEQQEHEQQQHQHEDEDEQQKYEDEHKHEQSEPVVADANINPDGSMIIDPNTSVCGNNDVKQTPHCGEVSPASLLFAELQKQYDLRQHEQQRQQVSKEDARINLEEEHRRTIAQEEARLKALERQRAAEQCAEEEAQRQRLHRQAEETRLRRRAQEEAKKEAERQWLDSIRKGPEGVKYYIDTLLQRQVSQQQQQQQQPEEGKDKDPIDPDRIVALRSLCTLFEQIQKNPEEVNKRKIKLTNPNFHQDIGRHDGGVQLLIAAGFRPTMLPAAVATTDITDGSGVGNGNDNDSDTNIDREDEEELPDIAFLISKEPNLEHDMDGWMAWFDLNKAALEILQTELQRIEGNNKRSRR